MNRPNSTTSSIAKLSLNGKEIVLEGLIVLLIAFSIYLFIALFTFSPTDPGWSQTAVDEPIKNIGGRLGAYLSDILLQFFGYAAYTIPVLGLFLGVKLAYQIFRHNCSLNYFIIAIKIIGVFTFLFSLCGFMAINVQNWIHYPSGGMLGSLIAMEIIPMLNRVGSSIVVLCLLAMSITLLTELSWLVIAEYVGKVVSWLIGGIAELIRWLMNRPAIKKQSQTEFYHRQNTTNFSEVQVNNTPLNFEHEPFEEDDHSYNNIANSTRNNSNPYLYDDEPVVAELIRGPIIDDRNEYAINTDYPPFYGHKLTEITSPIDGVYTDEKRELPTESQLEPDNIISHSDKYIDLGHRSPSSLPQTKLPSDYVSTDTARKNRVHGNIFYIDKYNSYCAANEQSGFFDSDDLIKSAADDVATMVSDDSIIISKQEEENISAFSENFPLSTRNKMPTKSEKNTFLQDSVSDIEQNDTTIKEKHQKISVTRDEGLAKESLIHPLLMQHNQPLEKPTTPLPTLDLLTPPQKNIEPIDTIAIKQVAELVENSLANFRVNAKVVGVLPGPVITLYELELAPGVKAARISTLSRDLARSLSVAAVRVVEVIPGKPYVGLELPNKKRQTVYIREVLDSPQFKNATSPLSVVLGKDIAGESVVADLAKMPHVLVAGTTGSGKSVGVNAMIISILYKATPEEVRFIMIDPKMLELSVYQGIPHLLTEVVTDMKDAANALNWCVNEMERRYRLMSALGVRNITGYNEKIKLAEKMARPIPDPLWKPGDTMDSEHPMLGKLTYIVVIVDEFADLIMAVGKKIEELIARLAQKARAAGIHLVLATQRPSVDVITGLIKANIPTRIAFTVSSKIDSRTILDQMGAESLLGMGDMLYLPPNNSLLVRVHGAFVRDEEVHAVAQNWKARGTPKYIENITAGNDDNGDATSLLNDEEIDPLFDQAVSFVVDKRRASISSIQRQFRIGYNRAARIVEQMEVQGVVSAPNNSGNREVLAPPSSYDDY